jgi:multidrug resistance efflux pump
MNNLYRRKYIFLLIVFLITGSYFLFFLNNEEKNVEQVVLYEHQVTTGRMADSLMSSVNASSRNKVELSFGLSGEINQITVGTGDVVKKGEVLAILESSTASRQVQVKEILLSQQEANLEDLLADPIASAIASAKQTTANARSSVANAEFNLKNLKEGSLASTIQSQRQTLTTAKFNLDNLINPSAATIANSNSSIKNAQTSLERSQNDVDELWPKLIKSQEDYCRMFQDWVAVCNVGDIPLSDARIKGLLDSLTLALVPQGTQRTKTEALLTANANYADAVNSVISNEAASLSAKEANKKLKSPSILEVKKLTEAVTAAQVRLNEYLASPEQLEIDKLNASLDSAKANLEYALAREAELTAGALANAINRKKQDVQIAQLNLTDAQTNLANHILTAPFDGIVGSVNVTLGQRIGSSTAVTTLSDPSSIYIEIPASESDLSQMQVNNLGFAVFDGMPGQFYIVKLKAISVIPNISQGVITYPAEGEILIGENLLQEGRNLVVLLDSLSKTIGLDAPSMSRPSGPPSGFAGGNATRPEGSPPMSRPSGPPSGFAGGPAMRAQDSSMTGMGSLMMQFANPKLPLDGMSGTLTLVTNIQEDVLLVPNNAIKRVGRENTVTLKNIDGITEQRVVQTGNDDGSNIAIISGLEEGEIILIESKKSIKTDKAANPTNSRPPGPPGSFSGGPR